jgi:hypothetical protein
MHWKKSVVNRSGFQAVAQFVLGRDAALRCPRPRSAGGTAANSQSSRARVAPLNAARTSQRDVPTTFEQDDSLPDFSRTSERCLSLAFASASRCR